MIRGAAGTLVNQGTISLTVSTGAGAVFSAGGTVTNGASGATAALISGGYAGVVFAGAPGTVTNFGSIKERTSTAYVQTPSILLSQGGTITNNGVIHSDLGNHGVGPGFTIEGGTRYQRRKLPLEALGFAFVAENGF